MSDLVERLRERASSNRLNGVCLEAADRITELEAEVERLKDWGAPAMHTIKELEARAETAEAALAKMTADRDDTYQARVRLWMLKCFGQDISDDRFERNCRFLEESLELVQSVGMTRAEAMELVDYVYGRPLGEPGQEVGGVMVTLAALCAAHCLSMSDEGETELRRVSNPSTMARIRTKQANKPDGVRAAVTALTGEDG